MGFIIPGVVVGSMEVGRQRWIAVGTKGVGKGKGRAAELKSGWRSSTKIRYDLFLYFMVM